MTYIYCKTRDDLNRVGELLCRANSVQDKNGNDLWAINEAEDECWIVETNCNRSPVAVIYRIGTDVVCLEVDANCAPNAIEPLIKQYGFDNVKWLLTK